MTNSNLESFEDIMKRADICIKNGQHNLATAFIALAILRELESEE